MKTAVLCCCTLRDEMILAESRVKSGYDFFFTEKNLHDFPDLLGQALQQMLDDLKGYDRVLLGFGFCGNAVLNLKAGDFELILPRCDDCISLLLGSFQRRKAIVEEHPSLFLTRGWIDGKKGAWDQYCRVSKRYDEETTQMVFQQMYDPFDQLVLLDTEAYDIDDVLEKSKILADAFHLSHCILPAGTERLEQLLTGPWDNEQFITVLPGEHIRDCDLLSPQ